MDHPKLEEWKTVWRERRSVTMVYILLRISVVLVMLAQIFNGNLENVFLCVLTLILFMMPSVLEKKLDITLPNTLEIIILLFIYAAEIMGEIGAYYVTFPYWDTVLHTLNGFLCAAIGFSLLDIKRYVESLGMRGRGYRVNEEKLRSLRVPSLVLMDVNGFRHFVVLKQVRDELVEIGDPILGNRVVPLPEFLDAWPSRAVFVVIGSDFDRNTVLLEPTTRPSARALYARQGPLTDAELLDFGFSHADLF